MTHPSPAEQDLLRGAERMTEEDLRRVLDDAEDLRRRARGPLGRFVEDIELLLALTRAWATGAYREIPWASLAAIAFSLLYILNPLDLVPDTLPLLGQLDDATILALCLRLVQADLRAFRAWRSAHPRESPST